MSDQTVETQNEPLPEPGSLKRAGKGIALVVVCVGVAVTVAIVVFAGIVLWQITPRSSVGIDSPEQAKPKLIMIQNQISNELTAKNGGFVNGRSSDAEMLSCNGPDGEGATFDVKRELDHEATEEDYEAAVELMKSLAGWSLDSADAEPKNGLTQTVFTHEEVGGIVVSFQRKASPPRLTLLMSSYCFRE